MNKLKTLLVVLLLAGSVGLAAKSFATAGDITLATPVATSVSEAKVCLTDVRFDLKLKRAVLGYESCNGATPPVFRGHVYTLIVTTTESTVRQPFAADIVNTNVTWTNLASDFSTVPATAKTFALRVLSGS